MRLIFGETAGRDAAVHARLRTGRRHSGAGEHRPPRGSLKGLCPVPAARLEGPSLAPDAEGGSPAVCRGWRPARQMAIEVDGGPPRTLDQAGRARLLSFFPLCGAGRER